MEEVACAVTTFQKDEVWYCTAIYNGKRYAEQGRRISHAQDAMLRSLTKGKVSINIIKWLRPVYGRKEDKN